MHNPLRRLLITLVLLAVAVSVVSTVAHARMGRLGPGLRPHQSVSVMIGSSVGARPASGEPDAGSSKNPPVIGQSQIVNPYSDGGGSAAISVWIQRIGMIWMAQYLGAR